MKERRKQVRCNSGEHFTVVDSSTDRPIGILANLSDKGAMLVTPGPVKEKTVFECRVDLAYTVMDRNTILFEAECLWCRKNVKAGQWESGYSLNVTGADATLVQYLMLSFRLQGRGADEIPDVKKIEMVNRRESVRYEFDHPLEVFERHSYRQIGELADLSARGMRIITPRPIEKNSSLHCRVKLPREVFRHEYLVLQTECMWSRPAGAGQGYTSGHRIACVQPPHEAILAHLLIHHGKPQIAGRQKTVVT